jgi:flagellar hook protein FlgE
MSISNALQTGVSGLRANSTAVGRISDNIANANTDGYRRSFAQMVTTTTTSSGATLPAAGVNAAERTDVSSEGSLRSTTSSTDLAVAGNGFFVVSKNPNDPVESNYFLTRAGSFRPDESGNLRNAAGYYLAALPYDDNGSLGLVDRNQFGGLSTVNVGDGSMKGAPTSLMSLNGNLPSQETGLATPGDPFISSAEFFSPLGASQRLQFAWQPTATPSEWTLTVRDEQGVDFGSVTATFHDSGALAGAPLSYGGVVNSAVAPANFTFNTATGTAQVTVDNGTTPQVIDIEIGAPNTFDGMTQFAGDYTPLNVDADGSQTGTLVRTEITDSGDVFGVFDNGRRKALYNMPLAVVPNPDGLIATNGNAYLPSPASGDFRLSNAGAGATGTIVSGSLEGSNVEVAQELTDLIRTQRAYSSNAKIVTTADEMLDETLRLKR